VTQQNGASSLRPHLETYQQDFLNDIVSKLDLYDKVILEIGCGNGSIVKTIALDYYPKHIYGIEPGLETWWGTSESNGKRYSIIDGDGEDIQFPDYFFDVVITLATFEHIEEPEKCLAEIKRVLKNGGEFYTLFAPVWNSIIGHHWQHWTNDVLKIPPWGHLFMSYQDMFDHLVYEGESHEFAKGVCEFIYNSDVINRIDVKRLEFAFRNCGMAVVTLIKSHIKNRLTMMGGADDDELTNEIRSKLKKQYTDEDLYTASMLVHLKNGDEQRTHGHMRPGSKPSYEILEQKTEYIRHMLWQTSQIHRPYYDVPIDTHRSGFARIAVLYFKKLIRKSARFLAMPYYDDNYHSHSKFIEVSFHIVDSLNILKNALENENLMKKDLLGEIHHLQADIAMQDTNKLVQIPNKLKRVAHADEIIDNSNDSHVLYLDAITTNTILLKDYNRTGKFPDYEWILQEQYTKLLDPGDVVLDIGAHKGRHLSCFLDLVKDNGKVFAFEPLRSKYKELISNFGSENNVYLYNVALSDSTGTLDFHENETYPEESGLQKRIYNRDDGIVITYKVDVITLDEMKDNFTKVDYVKIDTEGAEISILRGASGIINEHRPIISLEYGGTCYHAYGHTKSSLFELSSEINYLVTDIYGNIIPTLSMWNILCDTVYWDYFIVPEEKIDFFLKRIHSFVST